MKFNVYLLDPKGNKKFETGADTLDNAKKARTDLKVKHKGEKGFWSIDQIGNDGKVGKPHSDNTPGKNQQAVNTSAPADTSSTPKK